MGLCTQVGFVSVGLECNEHEHGHSPKDKPKPGHDSVDAKGDG